MLPDHVSLESVRNFLLVRSGKVEYHELVHSFKHLLTDQDARIRFKDCVNTLADVIQENNAKFLVLKPNFFPKPISNVPLTVVREVGRARAYSDAIPEGVIRSVPAANPIAYHDPNRPVRPPSDLRPLQPPVGIPENVVYGDIKNPVVPLMRVSHRVAPAYASPASAIAWSPAQASPDQPPQPPPRRRTSSTASTLSSSSFLRNSPQTSDYQAVQLNRSISSPGLPPQESKEQLVKTRPHQDEKLKEIRELANTPGRVKEHAEKWNKMTSESDLKQLVTTPQGSKLSDNKEDADTDSHSGSVTQPLDPLRKRWMIAAALCDYSELAAMLKEDPKLGSFKDITSGYTALHWAAKFGREDIVELLAGKYFLNPNGKSGGYTPLHMASMFGNLSVRDSLLTYQADPNIRDHSGKLAKHYEPRSKENMASKVPDIDQPVKSKHSHRHQFGPSNSHKSLSSRPSSESSLSHAAFSRIGSLNMKMKKTARALSGMKNWGSSESVNDSNLMPPPKSKGSKKKKSKTRSVSSALETVPATNEKDSDSDYGFH